MPVYPDVVIGVVVVDCHDPARLAAFWGELLGRGVVPSHERWVDLEWAPKFGVGMSFQAVPELKQTKNRLHVDVFCVDVEAEVSRVEALGGRRADILASNAVVMLDPEGNEFCLVRMPG
jgi:predicted enzyme related to lactoylglutathione lyase